MEERKLQMFDVDISTISQHGYRLSTRLSFDRESISCRGSSVMVLIADAVRRLESLSVSSVVVADARLPAAGVGWQYDALASRRFAEGNGNRSSHAELVEQHNAAMAVARHVAELRNWSA
jgi:hypothetical protein